jgi:hypothetical protein
MGYNNITHFGTKIEKCLGILQDVSSKKCEMTKGFSVSNFITDFKILSNLKFLFINRLFWKVLRVLKELQ